VVVAVVVMWLETGFREFFENPIFRADGLKIYPTLVIRGTGLYELWKTGRYCGVFGVQIATYDMWLL